MAKRELWELKSMQAAPLDVKILMTKTRIREWIREYGEDGVYISFSGGKDSTVLLDIVRQDYPNVPAVFCDTGLEYPEIREFVKTIPNVEWIRPAMTFKQVIEKCGYPMISKEVSECVYGARRYLDSILRGGGCQVGTTYRDLIDCADAASTKNLTGGGTRTSTLASEESGYTNRGMPKEFPQRWRQLRGIAEYNSGGSRTKSRGSNRQRARSEASWHTAEEGQNDSGEYP